MFARVKKFRERFLHTYDVWIQDRCDKNAAWTWILNINEESDKIRPGYIA